MKKIIALVLLLVALTGCGQSYNVFTEADIAVISAAVQVEVNGELCLRYNLDLENKAINIWCPGAGGYRLIASRIKDRIFTGIEDKPIKLYLYFEQRDSDDYDTFEIFRE